jgi:uncharacterized surface protein with fasciclin (FAS1) repeats
MTTLRFNRIKRFFFYLPALLVVVLYSCVETMDKNGTYRVSDGLLIDEYVEQNADLSTCYNLIQMSSFAGMLHGYGSYTFFAPTNEAFSNYLTSIGKTDISELTKAQADSILRYHIIRDSIKTTEFEDGRLPSPTVAGKYLTNKTLSDVNDNVYIRMNRQANITTSNVSCDNGILHLIDAIMTPPQNNIIKGISNMPDSLFSISKYIALTYSRFCPDSMSTTATDSLWFTFLAQDNQSYIDLNVGITQNLVDRTLNPDTKALALDTIKSKLLVRLRKNQPDEKSDNMLLSKFTDYHVIPSLKYIGDLLYASALESSVKNQSISFKLNGLTLLVNYYEIGSTIEPGVELNRSSEFSDLACSNGVIHYIGGSIEIKNRSAYRVYWDMATQPEIMASKDFRKGGTTIYYAPADLSEVEWGGPLINNIWYYCSSAATSTSLDVKNQYAFADMMRFRFSPNINSWFEWKLPLLVAGKYKVWVCWRREQTTTFRAIFRQDGRDDQVLPYVFNLADYYPGGTVEENLANGWKIYPAKNGTGGVMNCRVLGTIVVESTGRHTFRFEDLTGRSGETSWDMIQFIPVDEDQLWPRVDIRGKWIYQDTPDCEIWPYTLKVSSNYQGNCVW